MVTFPNMVARPRQEAVATALKQEADKAGKAADRADKIADDSIESLLSALQKACPAVSVDALAARKLAKEARQKAEDAVTAWVKAQASTLPSLPIRY